MAWFIFRLPDGTRFKALDAESGRMEFSIQNKDVSFSSPALLDRLAYYGTTDGWLHAVDIKTGRMAHEFQTEGSKENSDKYLDAHGKQDFAKIYPDHTLDGIMVGLNRIHSTGSILSFACGCGWSVVCREYRWIFVRLAVSRTQLLTPKMVLRRDYRVVNSSGSALRGDLLVRPSACPLKSCQRGLPR